MSTVLLHLLGGSALRFVRHAVFFMSFQYKRTVLETVHVHISHGYVNVQATHHNGTLLNKTRACFHNHIQNSIRPTATVSFSRYQLIRAL